MNYRHFDLYNYRKTVLRIDQADVLSKEEVPPTFAGDGKKVDVYIKELFDIADNPQGQFFFEMAQNALDSSAGQLHIWIEEGDKGLFILNDGEPFEVRENRDSGLGAFYSFLNMKKSAKEDKNDQVGAKGIGSKLLYLLMIDADVKEEGERKQLLLEKLKEEQEGLYLFSWRNKQLEKYKDFENSLEREINAKSILLSKILHAYWPVGPGELIEVFNQPTKVEPFSLEQLDKIMDTVFTYNKKTSGLALGRTGSLLYLPLGEGQATKIREAWAMQDRVLAISLNTINRRDLTIYFEEKKVEPYELASLDFKPPVKSDKQRGGRILYDPGAKVTVASRPNFYHFAAIMETKYNLSFYVDAPFNLESNRQRLKAGAGENARILAEAAKVLIEQLNHWHKEGADDQFFALYNQLLLSYRGLKKMKEEETCGEFARTLLEYVENNFPDQEGVLRPLKNIRKNGSRALKGYTSASLGLDEVDIFWVHPRIDDDIYKVKSLELDGVLEDYPSLVPRINKLIPKLAKQGLYKWFIEELPNRVKFLENLKWIAFSDGYHSIEEVADNNSRYFLSRYIDVELQEYWQLESGRSYLKAKLRAIALLSDFKRGQLEKLYSLLKAKEERIAFDRNCSIEQKEQLFSLLKGKKVKDLKIFLNLKKEAVPVTALFPTTFVSDYKSALIDEVIPDWQSSVENISVPTIEGHLMKEKEAVKYFLDNTGDWQPLLYKKAESVYDWLDYLLKEGLLSREKLRKKEILLFEEELYSLDDLYRLKSDDEQLVSIFKNACTVQPILTEEELSLFPEKLHPGKEKITSLLSTSSLTNLREEELKLVLAALAEAEELAVASLLEKGLEITENEAGYDLRINPCEEINCLYPFNEELYKYEWYFQQNSRFLLPKSLFDKGWFADAAISQASCKNLEVYAELLYHRADTPIELFELYLKENDSFRYLEPYINSFNRLFRINKDDEGRKIATFLDDYLSRAKNEGAEGFHIYIADIPLQKIRMNPSFKFDDKIYNRLSILNEGNIAETTEIEAIKTFFTQKNDLNTLFREDTVDPKALYQELDSCETKDALRFIVHYELVYNCYAADLKKVNAFQQAEGLNEASSKELLKLMVEVINKYPRRGESSYLDFYRLEQASRKEMIYLDADSQDYVQFALDEERCPEYITEYIEDCSALKQLLFSTTTRPLEIRKEISQKNLKHILTDTDLVPFGRWLATKKPLLEFRQEEDEKIVKTIKKWLKEKEVYFGFVQKEGSSKELELVHFENIDKKLLCATITIYDAVAEHIPQEYRLIYGKHKCYPEVKKAKDSPVNKEELVKVSALWEPKADIDLSEWKETKWELNNGRKRYYQLYSMTEELPIKEQFYYEEEAAYGQKEQVLIYEKDENKGTIYQEELLEEDISNIYIKQTLFDQEEPLEFRVFKDLNITPKFSEEAYDSLEKLFMDELQILRKDEKKHLEILKESDISPDKLTEILALLKEEELTDVKELIDRLSNTGDGSGGREDEGSSDVDPVTGESGELLLLECLRFRYGKDQVKYVAKTKKSHDIELIQGDKITYLDAKTTKQRESGTNSIPMHIRDSQIKFIEELKRSKKEKHYLLVRVNLKKVQEKTGLFVENGEIQGLKEGAAYKEQMNKLYATFHYFNLQDSSLEQLLD